MMIDDDDDDEGGGAAAAAAYMYRPVHVHLHVREEKMGIPTILVLY